MLILCYLTVQAKKVLVESYKQLRTGDAAPGSRTAYRITVRQLEALVRLSEAHARVRCDEWIQPRDVREVLLPDSQAIIPQWASNNFKGLNLPMLYLASTYRHCRLHVTRTCSL